MIVVVLRSLSVLVFLSVFVFHSVFVFLSVVFVLIDRQAVCAIKHELRCFVKRPLRVLITLYRLSR